MTGRSSVNPLQSNQSLLIQETHCGLKVREDWLGFATVGMAENPKWHGRKGETDTVWVGAGATGDQQKHCAAMQKPGPCLEYGIGARPQHILLGKCLLAPGDGT